MSMTDMAEVDVPQAIKVLSTDIDLVTWQRFKEIAEVDDRSIAAQLRVVVREYVEDRYRR